MIKLSSFSFFSILWKFKLFVATINNILPCINIFLCREYINTRYNNQIKRSRKISGEKYFTIENISQKYVISSG